MPQKKIKITKAQQEKFDALIKQSKFDRLAYGLIAEKGISADDKAKLILKLRNKMFPKKNRF